MRRLPARHVEAITYNLKVGRDPEAVVGWLERQLRSQGVRVAFLQEAATYQRVLDRLPGYVNHQDNSRPDSANVAILVRRPFRSRLPILRTMRRRWWGAKNRRWRKPRSLLSVRAFGVRWTNVHRVAFQSHAVNRRANEELDRGLIAFLNARPRQRHVVCADWNDGPGAPAIKMICDAAGLEIPAGAAGIDYPLFRGRCEVDQLRRMDDDGGSDHHPKRFRVRVWRRATRRRRRAR